LSGDVAISKVDCPLPRLILPMMLKDYYKILELSPQASAIDIRRNFRKLAMRYHPDKHPEDLVAAAHFREIQEAYETLMDPERRDLYLQERWYSQSMGRKMRERAPLTTHTILQDIIALDKHLAGQDPFRTDQTGIESYLHFLLSEEAISMLTLENNRPSLFNIRDLLLRCSRHFNMESSLALSEKIRALFPEDRSAQEPIDQFLEAKKHGEQLEIWKVPVFLVVTLLLCMLIYFSARR
jgi:molecular chaperone DnaJ